MGHLLRRPVSSRALAVELGVEHFGLEVWIDGVASVDRATPGTLCFSLDHGSSPIGSAVIAPYHGGQSESLRSVISSTNPRLHFALALRYLLDEIGLLGRDSPPIFGRGCQISASAVLSPGVSIGQDTVVGHNVVIASGVTIGSRCVIKSNTVIGESGFGFVRDAQGAPVAIPHIGSVIIGNRVQVGSLNTVCSGTLDPTVLEDDVKTDDHVHIAHNCVVGSASLLTACAELSGGVHVGKRVWIGPNSSVKQKLRIGDDALIGIAANVIRDVDSGAVVMGNPAKVRK